MKRAWPCVALVLMAACSSQPGNPKLGSTDVPKGSMLKGLITAPECKGSYNITNVSVEVRNQANTLIGTATTGDDISSQVGCIAEFTVDLTEPANFYTVKVGTHDGPAYSKAELDTQDWSIALTLK